MAKEKSFEDLTWKRVNTLGQLKNWLNKLTEAGIKDDEKVFMYSDEEGNAVNKILCLALYKEGLTFVPWEGWNI